MNIDILLNQYFGHNDYRGPQKDIIRHILDGNNALIIMPTGMGKSLCYQIPALAVNGLTLVISPLIALMQDQVDRLRQKNIDATYINSSLSTEQRHKRYEDIRQGHFRLLYVTPERFRKQEFLDSLKTRKIKFMAVDEAHCISNWGHDFRPDYTRLGEIRAMLGNPVTIALTATATPQVQQDIIEQLNLSEKSVKLFHEGIERPNLRLTVEQVWGEEDKINHLKAIRRKQTGNMIAYFSLIKTLEQFSDCLTKQNISHLCYHGRLDQQQRKAVQNTFMTGSNNLILATNAFGMGIDKKDIRTVIHAEVPGSIESYYQEIGRAGRDNILSSCILLYDQQDLLIHMDFIKWNNPDAEFYRRLYSLLTDNMNQFHAVGLEELKEELHFKYKRDFRLETGLRMLDRFNVTEGSLENKNLTICTPLPDELTSDSYLQDKQRREQQKLYNMVEYAKTKNCRKAFIHTYFGLSAPENCGICDICR